MAQFSTSCTVVNGKLKLFDLDGFKRGVQVFCDGEELELFLESVGEKYTRAQEKFFHGPVLKAFMTTGLRKQEAKDMLALEFIPVEIRRVDGSLAWVPGHTSALKKQEYSEFIESCIQLAAEQGLVVEDADQWRAKQRGAVRVS